MTPRERLELLREYKAAGGTGSYVSLLKEVKQYGNGGPKQKPVLPYSPEALASGTPAFYQQRNLPRHPLAPNLRQVSEEAEQEYFKSIDFIKETYKDKIKPTDEDVANFAKEVFGSTWGEYYNETKNLNNSLVFDENTSNETYKIATEIDKQLALRRLSGYYDYTTGKIYPPDSIQFKQWYSKNNPMAKLEALPKKFNYTYNPKPTNTLGFYNPKIDEYSVDVNENAVKNKKFTSPIHELTHRLDFMLDYSNRETTPEINVNLLNRNKENINFDQEGFDYLSDPFEIRARKNSLKYYLKNNNKPYKNIPEERLDSLYKVRKTLPSDVGQLLDLYNYQQEDLLKYLNK